MAWLAGGTGSALVLVLVSLHGIPSAAQGPNSAPPLSTVVTIYEAGGDYDGPQPPPGELLAAREPASSLQRRLDGRIEAIWVSAPLGSARGGGQPDCRAFLSYLGSGSRFDPDRVLLGVELETRESDGEGRRVWLAVDDIALLRDGRSVPLVTLLPGAHRVGDPPSSVGFPAVVLPGSALDERSVWSVKAGETTWDLPGTSTRSLLHFLSTVDRARAR
jgi:hypothetical protein